MSFVNVNRKIWMTMDKFIAQLVQPLLAARDENERPRPPGQLARKLAAEPGGGAGNQRVTAVEFHFIFAEQREIPRLRSE